MRVRVWARKEIAGRVVLTEIEKDVVTPMELELWGQELVNRGFDLLSGNIEVDLKLDDQFPPTVCPDHGQEFLRVDKENRGDYCAKKLPSGVFCGKKSWKGWKV